MIEAFVIIIIVILAAITANIRNKDIVGMSFRESMNLVELPVITFCNGTNKLNFLLDTGANMCVINSRVLNSLKYEKISNESGYMYGMEGNIIEVEYISMEFTYNDKPYKSTFQVVDMQESFDKVKQESGVTIHGILGSKFFEEYKYVLDFKELIAYSK